MAIRTIVQDGDPILKKKCRPVTEFNEKLGQLLDDMGETMIAANGLGLAGPQVGMLKRCFVVLDQYLDEDDNEVDEILEFVNPEILEMSGSEEAEEGCLSVPGYAGLVERATYVKIKALDIDGSERILETEGWAARVIQHENDHLDGILYIDKAKDIREIEDEPDAEEGE